MKHFKYTEIEEEQVPEPAKKVTVRWLIDEKTGATNFAMRMFKVEPGGSTPHHAHPWEHEVYILSGRGQVLGEKGEKTISPGDIVFIPPNEKHMFTNSGEGKLKFLCLIPIEK